MVYDRGNIAIRGQPVTFSPHCFVDEYSTGVSDEAPMLQLENDVCAEKHWNDLCRAL